jgi:hypothetical protein
MNVDLKGGVGWNMWARSGDRRYDGKNTVVLDDLWGDYDVGRALRAAWVRGGDKHRRLSSSWTIAIFCNILLRCYKLEGFVRTLQKRLALWKSEQIRLRSCFARHPEGFQPHTLSALFIVPYQRAILADVSAVYLKGWIAPPFLASSSFFKSPPYFCPPARSETATAFM